MDKEIKRLTINQVNRGENIKINPEEDIIVPDTRKDIKNIILKKGDVFFDSPKVSDGKCDVFGKLRYSVLYESDSKDGSMEALTGEIAFSESVNLDVLSNDNVRCDATLEDMTVNIINSRKISVSALVSCNLYRERVNSTEAVMKLSAPDVHTRATDVTQLSLVDSRKDILRVHESKSLKSDKPNMENIIWSTACLKCPEYRAENDELVLRGELHTFVIYTCEDAGSDVLYTVEIMPFSGRIKMNGIGPEMICDVEISVMNTNVSAKPDSDGELRNIDVEMTLGLDIKVYEESMVKLLCDAYSVDGGLYIEKQKTAYDTLLIRNQNKFKIADRFEAKDMDILQIVHTYSSVNVEEIIPLSDGIKVEGVAVFDIVCVSGKDNSRFVCMTKQVPFSEKIDVEGMRDDSFYSVRAIVCGQQAIMQGMDEIEIKLSAVLDVLVLGRETVDVVTMAEYREENAVQKKRGRIVGKVITKEENLWDIAKEYHTTVENIMEVNGLASENVGPGTRLIIL